RQPVRHRQSVELLAGRVEHRENRLVPCVDGAGQHDNAWIFLDRQLARRLPIVVDADALPAAANQQIADPQAKPVPSAWKRLRIDAPETDRSALEKLRQLKLEGVPAFQLAN